MKIGRSTMKILMICLGMCSLLASFAGAADLSPQLNFANSDIDSMYILWRTWPDRDTVFADTLTLPDSTTPTINDTIDHEVIYKVFYPGGSYAEYSAFWPGAPGGASASVNYLYSWTLDVDYIDSVRFRLKPGASFAATDSNVLAVPFELPDDDSVVVANDVLSILDIVYYYTGGDTLRWPTPVVPIESDSAMWAASATAKRCSVTVILKDASGNPVVGARVACYPERRSLRDSTGSSVSAATQRDQTDANGHASFECIWSSYLIPATKYVFTGYSPTAGRFLRIETIPRQSSYVISLTL